MYYSLSSALKNPLEVKYLCIKFEKEASLQDLTTLVNLESLELHGFLNEDIPMEIQQMQKPNKLTFKREIARLLFLEKIIIYTTSLNIRPPELYLLSNLEITRLNTLGYSYKKQLTPFTTRNGQVKIDLTGKWRKDKTSLNETRDCLV